MDALILKGTLAPPGEYDNINRGRRPSRKSTTNPFAAHVYCGQTVAHHDKQGQTVAHHNKQTYRTDYSTWTIGRLNLLYLITYLLTSLTYLLTSGGG